jgi:hypothetical protein
MVLVTLAGAVTFASGAQAGDAADESAAASYDGCGFGRVHLQVQNADEKAKTRAKIEALIDSALATKEAAVAPAATPVPAAGG